MRKYRDRKGGSKKERILTEGRKVDCENRVRWKKMKLGDRERGKRGVERGRKPEKVEEGERREEEREDSRRERKAHS